MRSFALTALGSVAEGLRSLIGIGGGTIIVTTIILL